MGGTLVLFVLSEFQRMIPEAYPKSVAPANYDAHRDKCHSAAQHLGGGAQYRSAGSNRAPMSDAQKIIELMPFCSFHFASRFPQEGKPRTSKFILGIPHMALKSDKATSNTADDHQKLDTTVESSQAFSHLTANRALRRQIPESEETR